MTKQSAKKAKTNAITKPVMYRQFIIAPTKTGGFDLIDPATGRWAHFETQRFAKWSSSFLSNINDRFTQNAALPASKIPHVEV
jgi:hypothetical protein